MNTISPLDELTDLKKAVIWMQQVLSSYDKSALNRKEISLLAKRAQKKIESYRPTDFEKKHKEAVIDLCISLSTIDRAEGDFENYYLSSLHDELEELSNLLGV